MSNEGKFWAVRKFSRFLSFVLQSLGGKNPPAWSSSPVLAGELGLSDTVIFVRVPQHQNDQHNSVQKKKDAAA